MAEGFRGVHAFVCVTEGKTCCMDAASEWLEWTRWLSSAFHTSWCAAHRMCGRAPVTARSLYFGFIVLPTGFNVQRLGPGWRKQLIWFTSCLRCPEQLSFLGFWRSPGSFQICFLTQNSPRDRQSLLLSLPVRSQNTAFGILAIDSKPVMMHAAESVSSQRPPVCFLDHITAS